MQLGRMPNVAYLVLAFLIEYYRRCGLRSLLVVPWLLFSVLGKLASDTYSLKKAFS